MAGDDYATEVDLSDVLRGFDLMLARSSNLTSVFQTAKEWLQGEVASHFAEGEGPEGEWPGPAESTQARKEFARGSGFVKRVVKGKLTRTKRKKTWARKPLGRLGQVKSYVFRVGPQGLTMQPRGAWAAIHQFGGVAGHGAKIPARPFLWFGEDLIERVSGAILAFLFDAWASSR
jgi:hypothetical protein